MNDKEYQKYLDTRVRMRCTNRQCELSSGFWTAEKFVDDLLTKLKCLLCGSKNAHTLKEVQDD